MRCSTHLFINFSIMLKELIAKHGKQKINSLTKYPSILTLHGFGEKGRLTDNLTTDLADETMFATEKIDGTNVRIICFGDEYLLGSREFLLHHSDDLFFDPAQGIVEGIKDLGVKIPNDLPRLTVIFGELFGGKVSSNSKQYGMEKIGFRVFDVAVYDDLSILDQPLEDISRWRERETEGGIIYGQSFLPHDVLATHSIYWDLVPTVPFQLSGTSHREILDSLKNSLPKTNVALTESAQLKPEGIILRNSDRSKIVKLRFEDYERTLR